MTEGWDGDSTPNESGNSAENTAPAGAEPSAEQWSGPELEWLQANGYKELGQPIHCEHDGHVGYKYPHEILKAYAAHVTKGLREQMELAKARADSARENLLERRKHDDALREERNQLAERAEAAEAQLAMAREALQSNVRLAAIGKCDEIIVISEATLAKWK